MMLCVVQWYFVVRYDRRRPGLSDAPLDMEYDNNRDHRAIALALDKHPNIIQISIFQILCHFTHARTRASMSSDISLEDVKHPTSACMLMMVSQVSQQR